MAGLDNLLAGLPLFARSVLHTGPVGLGVLRTAPAVVAALAVSGFVDMISMNIRSTTPATTCAAACSQSR